MLVEVCADRIELCSEIAVGGITPSYGLLKAVREEITIPVRVLIRPRSGDFMYSEEEFDIMKTDIKRCKELGFEGVVSGILKNDFTLDSERTEQLIATANTMKFTFHRAFDWVQNPKETLKTLQELGVDTVLSSGQEKTALKGIQLLSDLNKESSTLVVMPGSGIKESTASIFKEMGFKALHLSGVRMNQRLKEPPRVPMSTATLLADDAVPISHFKTLQAVILAVK